MSVFLATLVRMQGPVMTRPRGMNVAALLDSLVSTVKQVNGPLFVDYYSLGITVKWVSLSYNCIPFNSK